jgi:hypothetical protein
MIWLYEREVMKMKKILTTLLAALAVTVANAQTVLLDFGRDSTYRGKSTSGNWNSLSGGAFTANLIDTTGSATTIDFGPDGMGATDSFNGPAYSGQLAGWDFGGDTGLQQAALDQLASDTHTAIDNAALGLLGVGSAAMDFYGSTQGRFQIQQVTAGELYELTFYSSKKFPTDDTSTTISVFDDNLYSNLLGTTTVFHGNGGTANLDQVGTITGLTGPSNSNNIFYVQFEGDSGGTGYLNSMSISVIPEPSTLVLFGVFGVGILMIRRRISAIG